MGFFKSFKEKVSNVATTVATKAAEAADTLKFTKLKEGLSKTRDSFVEKIRSVLFSGRKIDQALLDEIEEILITSDIGVDTTEKIVDSVKKRVRDENRTEGSEVFEIIREEIEKLLITSSSAKNDAEYSVDPNDTPHVIMVIGVNGVGKTTTIGKLAYNYRNAGRKVIIGAADTFRAAANEQLEIWAERAGVPVIHKDQGTDPASVVFDTLKTAKTRGDEVVIIDTAGRLHNKSNLMSELEKMNRVMKKVVPTAPQDVFLVLDATTGQNAIQQAKEFMKAANISGIVLTKLDGTAKGGVVIPIACELQIPVRYIGVGEKIDDLQVFTPKDFVDALFDKVQQAADNYGEDFK